MRKTRKRISRAYRTYLFRIRMTNIIHLLLGERGICCYFCGKSFTEKDFPFNKRDKVEIHHTSYIPEVRVLAHKKCHRDYHNKLRRKESRKT